MAPSTLVFDPASASRYPLRILIADDNRVNQKVASSFLEKLGYRVEVVGNGLEVLQALERKSYDIVFLDIHMPEMDGYEAARQMQKRWPADDRPRIIAMTGNAMQGDRQRCLEAGMDDYIAKPVHIEDLRAALYADSCSQRAPCLHAGDRQISGDRQYSWHHRVRHPHRRSNRRPGDSNSKRRRARCTRRFLHWLSSRGLLRD